MRCRMPTLANPPWVCRATKEPSGADNEREKPPATEAHSVPAATQNLDNADTSADFETPDRAPTLGDVMTLGDLMAPAHMRPCKHGDEPCLEGEDAAGMEDVRDMQVHRSRA